MMGTEEKEPNWETVIEAVLFTMGKSVEVRQLAAAIGQDEETADQAAKSLEKRYEEENRGDADSGTGRQLSDVHPCRIL